MATNRICVGVALSLCLVCAAPSAGQTYFSEVTRQAIPATAPSSRSMAWGDYDNDGWLDLFVAQDRPPAGSPPRVALLHNNGRGAFDGVPGLPFVQVDQNPGGGAGFADLDNDGDLDLFLPLGAYNWAWRGPNRLLRNDQGVYRDVTGQSGLTDVLPTDNALWLDYDRDGYVDLYTGNLGADLDSAGVGNRLYRNRGDGTFTDVTAQVGPDVPLHRIVGGSNGGMTAADLNDDGWPDLYVGVYGDRNRLFLSDGQGRFRDATTAAISDSGDAFGLAVGDINNDGRIDLFQPAGGGTNPGHSPLLLNLGGGEFVDVAGSAGLSDLGSIPINDAVFADIDNDGDLDLVIANPPRLYLNNGDATFVDASSHFGVAGAPWGKRTLCVGDYDADGCLDVAYGMDVAGLGRFGGLYRNNGNANHWLRVELVGTRSNRSAIGARLSAVSGDLTQTRQILGGRGYEQDELVAHFGLGDRVRVDRLEVRWPSGKVEVLTDLPVDQQIRVIEGQGRYHRVQRAAWMPAVLAATVVVGAPASLRGALRPPRFEEDSRITSVVADLSALGGAAAMPLVDQGDGTYGLAAALPAQATSGTRSWSVLVEQTTSLGPWWSRVSRSAVVLPPADLALSTAQSLPHRFSEALVIGGVGKGGSIPIGGDEIEDLLVRGRFVAPHAGDTLTAVDGTVCTWERVAFGDGKDRIQKESGAYAYATFDSETDRVVLLEASGPMLVYVNGEPRVGNGFGDYLAVSLPIALKKGLNEFVFVHVRRFSGELVACPSEQPWFLGADDTVPDLLVGESTPVELGACPRNRIDATGGDERVSWDGTGHVVGLPGPSRGAATERRQHPALGLSRSRAPGANRCAGV